MPLRIFTYAEASRQLEAVRSKTLAASERLETLRAQAEDARPDRAAQLREAIDEVVEQWTSDMMALGALPKGLFTVDFDSGKGFFYCWTLNEPVLDHMHRYEEGFAQRQPLPEEEMQELPPVLN
jgi:hypothetical protein